jgi:rubrerythrin
MQADSGADYNDAASAHAHKAAASDNNTASTAAPAGASVVTVAGTADIVDLVSDSEEDGLASATGKSASGSGSTSSTTASSAPVATVSVPAARSSSSSDSSAFSSALSKRSGKRKARPRAAAVGIAGLLDWCCKQCTLINAGSDNVCAACGGSKPSLTRGAALVRSSSPVNTTVDTAAGWTCDFCDTLNTAAATRCSDCDYPPGVLSNDAEQCSNKPVSTSAACFTSPHCHDDDVTTESSSSKSYKPLQSAKTNKVSTCSDLS